MGSPLRPSESVALVALGCPKNTVDAEVMLGDLQRRGYTIEREPDNADVVIVNTCAFIEEAKQESIDAVLEAGKLKEGRNARALLITGCLAQRYADELATALPEVDAVVGFESYGEIPTKIQEILTANSPDTVRQAQVSVGLPTVPFRDESDRVRIGPTHYAYLRVAEGCDHNCTFCAIPGFRGKFRSKGFDTLVEEARQLVALGAKELNLIAEDTNQWGTDFGAKDSRRLPELLEALSEIEGLKWIRLLYCYPSYFNDKLIDSIARLDKVVKYIDIPLQHSSSDVLARMQRPLEGHTSKLLQQLQDRIPDLVLRTTFISGFPGETEGDYEHLRKFSRSFGFQRGGVFSYSEEDGTPAAMMEDQIPQEVRAQRQMRLQRSKCHISPQIGRSYADAPDIDNQVKITDVIVPFDPGMLVKCKIVDVDGLDLIANVCDEI
eukprot:jgi/Bigna1/57266/fgenesh1_pm.8_\